jgi:hypothetical protein
LQEQIVQLQSELHRLTGRVMAPIDPEEQTDYIAHGSPEHAALLGLREATDEDRIVADGWALEDITNWPPTATEEYLQRTLRQKVLKRRARTQESRTLPR